MDRLKSLILKNTGLKLLSLFFALILWFYVNAKGMLETNYVVPLGYRNLPSSLVMVGEPVDYVDIRVKAREGIQNQSTPQHISAVVDLSGAKPGEAVFYLSEKNVQAPTHVEILRVSPRVIKVRLEPVVTKRVGVVAELVGKPAQGRVVKKIDVDPSVVTVLGAQSLVNPLQKVSTAPIDLTGAHSTFSKEVSLKPLGKEVRVVEQGPLVVRVILGEER